MPVLLTMLLALAASDPGVPAAAPPPAATSTPTSAPVLLFVMDVGGDQLAVTDRQALTESFTLSLARRLDLEVQSSRSLLDRVGFAQQQQQAGCDSSACMAEIANAMGARFVVFSRVVTIGNEQTLRADVYDNVTARTLALASVEGRDVAELSRNMSNLVDALISESLGTLPLRATKRPIAVGEAAPMSAAASNALLIGGGGLATALVFGGVFIAGSLQSSSIQRAARTYEANPDIDNARSLVDARGSLNHSVLTFGTCGSGCIGLGGVIALLVGSGLFVAEAVTVAPEP